MFRSRALFETKTCFLTHHIFGSCLGSTLILEKAQNPRHRIPCPKPLLSVSNPWNAYVMSPVSSRAPVRIAMLHDACLLLWPAATGTKDILELAMKTRYIVYMSVPLSFISSRMNMLCLPCAPGPIGFRKRIERCGNVCRAGLRPRH
jgi:hypothetical protein